MTLRCPGNSDSPNPVVAAEFSNGLRALGCLAKDTPMSSQTETSIMPRPVERLPEYAHAKARQSLADKLVEAFKLSRAAAEAIANGVVDPSEVRRAIGDITKGDPDVERIAVPGGTLLGLRTQVWTRRVMPDPRNPRLLPSRRHPFAVEPGTAGEDAKFRPVPEPRSPTDKPNEVGELFVDVESRHHLNWALQQAATYVLAENDWRDSIKHQGVMEAIWITATTYVHADGTDPVTALTTPEGSSRVTATHDNLSIRSADVPYDQNEVKLRAHLRKLNESLLRGPTAEEIVALRCERVPALILVGFTPYSGGSTGFPTAVKSLVALRHVDPPKPWGEGPENESLADEVLDEFYRRGLISDTQRAYYAGACTRVEARAAHLSDDPAIRAAQIVRTFTSDDFRFADAIRVAVTSQSTRKRITPKLKNELATALILRAVADERDRTDQVRRYMRHAFAGSVHNGSWEATDRTPEQLTTAALKEVRRAIAEGDIQEPGPDTQELAVRGAYALVVSGRLNADRNFEGDQPDRRTPGQVLDAMRRTPQGIHQLGQSILDFGTDPTLIRAVDETGVVKELEDGSGPQQVNDVYLRREFPPPGKAPAPRPGETVLDRYHNAVSELGTAIGAVDRAFNVLSSILGDDGRPVVEVRGVDQRICADWRRVLDGVTDELVVWARNHRRTMGASATASQSAEGTADLDEVDDGASDAIADWDADAESEVRQEP